MIRVEEAEQIIRLQQRDFGTETVSLEKAAGRVLAEVIRADRDIPPFNRSTMDGIALCFNGYRDGNRRFRITGTQAAGDPPLEISTPDACIEIMTGAVVPASTGTVVPYESVQIENGYALVSGVVTSGQNVHQQGQDRRQDSVLVPANQMIRPAVIAVAASVGKTALLVRKLPRVVIITTGDELVGADQLPEPYQIRQSNNYMIRAALQPFGLSPRMLHLPDDLEQVRGALADCFNQYEVILLSGGVSMGKFDYLPQAFSSLHVQELFHKVQQRPGKPLWFGLHPQGTLVFSFPGNPVATFLCLLRYFMPWLQGSLGILPPAPLFASLEQDFQFSPPLQYFLQVRLTLDHQGTMRAMPLAGNGSGDFSNLLDTDAFMELPPERSHFEKGESYRVWPYQSAFL